MKRPQYETRSTLAYEGPEQVSANALFSAVLRVHLKEHIKTGGRIVLAVRHVSDFGDAQMDDPLAENFISVQASRPDVTFALGLANDVKRHPWNRGIDLKVADGELVEGDTVAIRLGDPAAGCPGYRCQSFVESFFQFRLGVAPLGDDAWLAMPEDQCPGFRIVGNEAACLRAILSDMTNRGDKCICHIKAEDAYGNVAGSPKQTIRLLLDGKTTAAVVEVRPNAPVSVEVAVPADEQWHTIVAASDDGRFYGESNPAGPSPVVGYRLFWGDIHAQSELCDGTQSPREIYEYAQNAAGLDFAAVTSHDFELTAADWQKIRQAARDANQPGRFVTFLGEEWSGGHKMGGDNNIYYPDDDGPLVYSGKLPIPPAWEPSEGEAGETRTLAQVIGDLKGRPAMIVPHCGGRQCNLDFYDAALMPVMEVHSCHRSYDYVARQAIKRGMRIGFIGGSDDHRGAIGDSHPAVRDRFFSAHNGLAAVYARELTREALWEAFFNKRTYATNGPRIVLDVRLGGVLMGGQLSASVGHILKLAVFARLDGMLDAIEVVRDGMTIAYLRGEANQVRLFRQEIDIPAEAGDHAYYVKVRQNDGGLAWSSPIWVSSK